LTGTGLGLWERERLLEALDAHQRGLTEPPLIRKWNQVEGLSKDAGRDKPMAFVISTDDVDRHGDVIVSQGWHLESYRRNPVFLWAHDYARRLEPVDTHRRADHHRHGDGRHERVRSRRPRALQVPDRLHLRARLLGHDRRAGRLLFEDDDPTQRMLAIINHNNDIAER